MQENSNLNTIIFIDDDTEMVERHKQVLERKKLADYMISFHNAHDCLEYLQNANTKDLPGYILLDLYMPQMSGFDFLRIFDKQEELKNAIEIFVCSSSSRKRDRNQAMNYPFVSAYLEKPLPTDFLELLIKDNLC